MTREEVLAVIEKHETLDFKELKVSYLILKPNAARHYKVLSMRLKSNNILS